MKVQRAIVVTLMSVLVWALATHFFSQPQNLYTSSGSIIILKLSALTKSKKNTHTVEPVAPTPLEL